MLSGRRGEWRNPAGIAGVRGPQTFRKFEQGAIPSGRNGRIGREYNRRSSECKSSSKRTRSEMQTNAKGLREGPR